MNTINLAGFDSHGLGLAGALHGQQVLGALISSAPHPTEPTPLYLDFGKVKTATASFVRACVLGFKDYARKQNPNLYPVVANAPAVVLEDLLIVLNGRGDAMAICDLDEQGAVSNARVIGQLESKQLQTLEAVRDAGEADAGGLYEKFKHLDGVSSATAWNNRLASLASKGLLIERSRGRAKSYRCVLPELRYGN